MPAFKASSTTTLFRRSVDGGNEPVMDPLGHNDARRSRAPLAGREEAAVDRRFHGDSQIGIIQNDERILATHLQLEFAHMLDRGRSNPLAVPTDPVNVMALTSALSRIV